PNLVLLGSLLAITALVLDPPLDHFGGRPAAWEPLLRQVLHLLAKAKRNTYHDLNHPDLLVWLLAIAYLWVDLDSNANLVVKNPPLRRVEPHLLLQNDMAFWTLDNFDLLLLLAILLRT
ncbi:hypothetical protein BKA70DRAFT_1356019, partial [Coprinopsis sp. MPI-PUGE-AT-0042]